MDDKQRFRIAPMTLASLVRHIRKVPLLWPALLAPVFLLSLGASGLLIPDMRMPWFVGAVLVCGSLLLPALVGIAAAWSRSSFVEITDTRFIVPGALSGRLVDLQTINLKEARPVDLFADRAFWPAAGGGINLPGFFSGSGTTGRGERVTWLVTDPSLVVYIPALTGRSVLVSVQSPEKLVEALHSVPIRAEV